MDRDQLWAKTAPYKPLWQHMIDTGCVACCLMKAGFKGVLSRVTEWTLWSREEAGMFIGYIAAMHDIGKAHPLFQMMDAKTKLIMQKDKMCEPVFGNTHFRHEKYSQYLLKGYLRARTDSKAIVRNIPAIDGLHHQGKNGTVSQITVHPEQWKKLQDELEEIAYSTFAFGDTLSLDECRHIDTLCTALLGIIILSDWIASGELAEEQETKDSATYAENAYKRAWEAIKTCRLAGGNELKSKPDYSDYWPWLTSPRPLQTAVKEIITSDSQPDLMIIEAPMGEGKSEAALYAAMKLMNGRSGFYFALPTSATSNQMYMRVEEMVERLGAGQVRLLHSNAWSTENTASGSLKQSDAEDMSTWMMPLRRGMLSQNAVGTIDQAMLAVMRVNYGVIRLSGLVDKVLIIDEIHAYDMYMSQIIGSLLSWCGAIGVPVILLSATLPYAKKNELIKSYTEKNVASVSKEYPLITCCGRNGKICEIAAAAYSHRTLKMTRKPIMGLYDRVAAMALDTVKDGGCLCIIVNTVDCAQKLYMQLKAAADRDVGMALWHARFPAQRRKAIENACDKAFSKQGDRPKKAILVATQVAEQSCDYSFDYMMSEIAPIDLLLQRSGRLLRHEGVGFYGRIQPELVVLTPEDNDYGSSGVVYMPYLLNRTMQYLSGVSDIRLPEDMRGAIEYVYDVIPEDTTKAWLEYQFNNQLRSALGESVVMRPPSEDHFGMASYFGTMGDDESDAELTAATRLGEPSMQIILSEQADIGVGEALANSCTLRESLVPAVGSKGYQAPVWREGRLKGYVQLIMKNGIYEGVTKNKKNIRYRLDDELGLVTERGE